MAYRRVSIGADPGVNPTTIWTPSTGFLSTPGDITSGAPPAAGYVAPTLSPPPACSQDTQPGGAAFSQACIAQVLANQQNNMQLLNNANYAVDISSCNANWAENDAAYANLGLTRPPNTCASRTFGLTPTGGYTSDASVQGPGGQTILNAAGQPVTTPPPVFSPTPNPYVVATPTPTPARPAGGAIPAPPTSLPPGASLPSSSGDGGPSSSYVTPGTDFFSSAVAVDGFNVPIWGLLAGGAALLFLAGGRR